MAQKIDAGMPPDLDLDQNFQLSFAAVDPSTGAAVSGVTVSAATLVVGQLSQGSAADLQSGPFMLVPGPGA